MTFASLSDKALIIFLAYTAAFLPWTAFSTKDCISDKWKTVRRTRIAGYVNLCAALIPAIYILMYCSTQFSATDWKEGSAAFIALLFALLHGARSAWGIWQLHLFRTWCADSINALRAMGVTFSFSQNSLNEKFDGCSAWEISDQILVNDSIVDNQIFHGETVCHVSYGSSIHLKAPTSFTDLLAEGTEYTRGTSKKSSKPIWWKTVKLIGDYIAFMLKTVFCIVVMICDGLRFVLGVGTSGKLRQVPKRPVEVWINWAIIFAAQGLHEWMSDFKVSVNPRAGEKPTTSISGIEEWQKRASYFASEVLSTCIMQLWPEVEGKRCRNDVMEPMLWNEWKEGSIVHSGRLVKKDLLASAIESGEGLPFGAKQKVFLQDEETSDTEIGYSAFKRQLVSKIGNLDVRSEFCSEIERMDVEMLEWLTILLYIGRRAVMLRGNGEKSNWEEIRKSKITRGGFFDDGIDEIRDYSTDQAFRNLSEQLSSPLSFGSRRETNGKKKEEASVPSFPCSRRWMTAKSRNRHALRVGEVVDLWLAALAGDGLKFVLKLNEKWTQVCRGATYENTREQNNDNNSNKGMETGKTDASLGKSSVVGLREAHREVEKVRLRYQFGDRDCESQWGANYGMTFMGYRMETVRSCLAEWVRSLQDEHYQGCRRASFRGSLENMEDFMVKVRKPCELSVPLTRALESGEPGSTLRSKLFQVRLLWELQEHFEREIMSSIEREEFEIGNCHQYGPESLDMIALCILSFPSLRVDATEDNDSESRAVTKKRDWYGIRLGCCSAQQPDSTNTQNTNAMKLVIEPVCGPQQCQVRVRFVPQESSRRMSAMISISFGDEKEFVWEWWRDAFIGRLEGMKQWQADHYMNPSLGVIPSSGPIDAEFDKYKTVTKEKFRVWKGWRPFRMEICIFEVKRSGLLKERQRIQRLASPNIDLGYASRAFGFSKHFSGDVPYKEAQSRVLMHAMSLIRDSIRQDWTVNENDDEIEGENRDSEQSKQKELMTNAESLCRGEADAVERLLLLYETAVGEFGNEEALERGVELILNCRGVPDMRALDLLDMFVGYIIPPGQLTQSRVDSRTLGQLRGSVLQACEKLVCVRAQNVDETRLSEILLFLSRFVQEDEKELPRNLVEMVLCYSESFEVMTGYAELLGFVVNTKGNQLFAAATGEKERVVKDKTYTALDLESADSTKATTCQVDSSYHGLDQTAKDAGYRVCLHERAIQEHRSLNAMLNLGILCEYGAQGVSKDSKRAKSLFETAAMCGNPMALYNLARLLSNGGDGVEKDTMRAKHLYESAITIFADPLAMTNLGLLLLTGADGVQKDTIRAKELLEEAVEKGGDSRAVNILGFMLVNGADGVKKDVIRAKKLFERAVTEGELVYAMHNLGILLMTEECIDKDAVRAKELYEMAIEKGGYVEAMCDLGFLLASGAEGVEQDLRRAVQLYERAIEEGNHVKAMYNLALLLVHGHNGVEKDVIRAKALFERAITEGENVYAMHSLGSLLLTEECIEQDAVRAKELYEMAIEKGGYVEAICDLGFVLANGAEGVEQDLGRAVQLYERAIEEGNHVKAMYNLALLLVHGHNGVEKDVIRAKKLFERAVTEGENVYAMHSLGSLLLTEDYIDKDAARAKELYEMAVEKGGYVEAMCDLGFLLANGAEGVEKDSRWAVQLYERAIEEGNHVKAMYNLALLLVNGHNGVEKDVIRAKALFERAINEGDYVYAMHSLGSLLLTGDCIEQDAARAKELYEMAIEKGGYVEAMCDLGFLLASGAEGVEQDLRRAVQLYERAIDEGDHYRAMNNLGWILRSGGAGVSKDVIRAKKLFERAVTEGELVYAMHNLGVLLMTEECIDKDAVRAKELYEMAVEKGGYVEAMFDLGVLLEDGAEGVEKDLRRAVQLYERAIEEGEHVKAMCKLGTLLERGTDETGKDAARAKMLYERAIRQGADVNAMFHLGVLLVEGADGVARNAVHARELFERALQVSASAHVMHRLGELLSTGAEGVPQDVERGRSLLERAKQCEGSNIPNGQ